jgi:hypothetical protein
MGSTEKLWCSLASGLFDKATNLPDGPQRAKEFTEMNNLIFGYVPWIFASYPYQNIAVQSWLRGFKQNALALQQWRYYDVERQ